MSFTKSNYDVSNQIKNASIGSYVGRDSYNIFNSSDRINIFDTPIFLHFWGKKISKNIFQRSDNIKELLEINTKIILLLFDDILVSLSDATQSEFIYQNVFFRELLSYENNGEPLVTIIGTKRGKNLNVFLEEREEFYYKPGFYNIPSNEICGLLDNISKSIQPKSFDTGNTLAFKWRKTFCKVVTDAFKIEELPMEVRNVILSNYSFFQSSKVDSFINIPENLQGFPFIWDSINHLGLIKYYFDETSVYNLELYLAKEWVQCYIDNYDAKIPDILVGTRDCSMGIKNVVHMKRVYQFLRTYQLLHLLKRLNLQEILQLKNDCSYYFQKIIDMYANSMLIFKKQISINHEIQKIIVSDIKEVEKAKQIIFLLWNSERVM